VVSATLARETATPTAPSGLTVRLSAAHPTSSVVLSWGDPSPEEDGFHTKLVEHPRVLRVVALSGGYSRVEADERLSRQHGVVASFSRALTEGLHVDQTPAEFDAVLDASIASIYRASLT